MAETPRPPSSAGAITRKLLPPPALCGFLLLLALAFTVSYAVGSAAGPVAPGIHGTGSAGNGREEKEGGGGGGMEDMPGMTDGSGH
ncbi:hypothetical protein [Streptomyces sp. NPDC006335]|uniref:hypothetical protein n=1 Tax=Streptomyces sp. NPDC006335 TaxID=3156895 RepID=UPI0033A8E93F